MKETREINSFPIVTSLSSSDYLLTDSGKKILEQNVGKRAIFTSLGTGQKWIRIAKFSGTSIGFISIYNSWKNSYPCPLLLAFSFPASQYNSPLYTNVKLILGPLNIFNRARVVYKPNTASHEDCYLEVYQVATTENAYYVEMQNYRNATALCELGSIPSGYVAKEFALTVGVGGNLLVINQLRNLAERRVA